MKTTNVLNAIAALDLDSIKAKLMDAESGEGWSQAKADAMELEYRRFLHVMHAHPDEEASPTKAVDTFWHYHILDTRKYAADCEQVFGCFMHHNPNAAEGDEASPERAGDRMQELYEATFGEAYIRAEAYGLDQADVGADAAFADEGRGRRAMGGAKTAVCYTLCMRDKVPASAKAAVCYTLCMRQKLPASASASLS